MTILKIGDNQSTLGGHVGARERATPVTIQTRVQSIMNDIYKPSSSQGNNWNHIASSPSSKIYQETPIFDKFNTFRFEWYNRPR